MTAEDPVALVDAAAAIRMRALGGAAIGPADVVGLRVALDAERRIEIGLHTKSTFVCGVSRLQKST